jgi:hypothetical protein
VDVTARIIRLLYWQALGTLACGPPWVGQPVHQRRLAQGDGDGDDDGDGDGDNDDDGGGRAPNTSFPDGGCLKSGGFAIPAVRLT